jgi:hypothetical protein
MNKEADELSPEERRAFAELNKEQMPPSFLEERIVEKLKAITVIRSGRLGWLPGYQRIGIAFALSLMIFVTGAIVGARLIAAPPKKSDSPEFMLILRMSSPEMEAKTPEEELQRVKEYSAWARDLERRGLLTGGEKLKDEGRFLSQVKEGAAVAETPSRATAGAIAGYFLMPASDYEQAVTIARTCPHLKHGGTVEIRQIERF